MMPTKQESNYYLQEDDEEAAVSSGLTHNLSSSAPKKPTMASQGVLVKTIEQKNGMPPLLPGVETKQ